MCDDILLAEIERRNGALPDRQVLPVPTASRWPALNRWLDEVRVRFRKPFEITFPADARDSV
jgi:hypothetical protein